MPLIPEDALNILLSHITAVEEGVEIPLHLASGRVLLNDISAALAVPHFRRSPLDGYALHAADLADAAKDHPARLRVTGEADAGCTAHFDIRPGEALRIMTGAPVPDSCDCVIRQEDTNAGMETVEIYASLKSGMNVCPIGEDMAEGTSIARKGDVIDASLIGALATQGLQSVKVTRPVRVLLIHTGDELRLPGQALQYGQIYDSNGPTLLARLHELGAEPLTCPKPFADDPGEVAAFIRENLPHIDLIVSTGGVSVGKKDIMHEVLPLLGAERLFWRIAMKPGSPLLCGEIEKKLMICLSGNPFAARVGFELFVKPVLARLAGRTDPQNPEVFATLRTAFPKASPQRRMIQGRYFAGDVHLTGGSTTNGSTLGMVGCNCLIDIPAGSPPLQAGSRVRILML